MEKSIQTLQELVAHQQEDISRLSDELYTQQQEIARLQQQVALLTSRMAQAIADAATVNAGEQGKEPPPPHY